MGYVVRNRFQQGLAAEVGGPGPIRATYLGQPAAALAGGPPTNSAGQVMGAGPGYAAANQGNNKFNDDGTAQLAWNDPDADNLMKKYPGRYTKQEGPKQATLSSRPQFNQNNTGPGSRQVNTAGMPSDANIGYAGETPISLSEWMTNQLKTKPGSNWQVYAKGGRIKEPVVGVGQRSGNPYLFGENGPETVIPDNNAVESSEEDIIAELQRVLGRRIFAKRRRPIRKSSLRPEEGSQNENTARAVNAPVLRLGEDEIRQLVGNPQFGNLLAALAEAERQGGVEILPGTGNSSAPLGGSAINTGPTPNEQAAIEEEEARRAEEESQYLPGVGYEEPTNPDLPEGTPPGFGEPAGSTTYNYDELEPEPSDLSDPFGDPSGQMPAQGVYTSDPGNLDVVEGTPPGFGEPAGSTTYDSGEFQTEPSDLSDPFGDPGGQMASPGTYTSAPTTSTSPAPYTPPSSTSDPFGDPGGQLPSSGTYSSAPAPVAPVANPITWAPGWEPGGSNWATVGGGTATADPGATTGGSYSDNQDPTNYTPYDPTAEDIYSPVVGYESEEERLARLMSGGSGDNFAA
jgi:hypothetical protein